MMKTILGFVVVTALAILITLALLLPRLARSDECSKAALACGEGLPGCGEAIRKCANQGVTRPYYWPIIQPVHPIVTIDPVQPLDDGIEAFGIPANEGCDFPGMEDED